MKILITGNMGYIGPVVIKRLRHSYPNATLIGLDLGYFAHCLTQPDFLPETILDIQHFQDVRKLTADLLEGIDAIVHLAAISNDPMGNQFEAVTEEINYRASVRLAQLAKEAGVSRFVFASSCSMYGFANDGARTEQSTLNPLTAYARSKVATELELIKLASPEFIVTCLRFATACGASDRLRLDLVLNDFVAGAVAEKKITVMSDGTPWRPLIAVSDMAKAMDWAISRSLDNGGAFLAVNAGSNRWNYQVRDLATAVAQVISGTDVFINENAPPDKRSYRVNFDLFNKLAPAEYQPECNLDNVIRHLKDRLESMGFDDTHFRSSSLMRLNVLNHLKKTGLLTETLEWSVNRF
ncbi:MAG: SDR family oxidoreductase [Methylococcales bacterium]|nr:SDR family oxidoreductase [Methylococcales bacterium]